MEELDADRIGDFLEENNSAIVDFWAPWCGPCRSLAPVMEQVEQELKGEVTIARVNIETSPKLAEDYGVQSIPTLIYFKKGNEIKRTVGMTTKALILGNAKQLNL